MIIGPRVIPHVEFIPRYSEHLQYYKERKKERKKEKKEREKERRSNMCNLQHISINITMKPYYKAEFWHI